MKDITEIEQWRKKMPSFKFTVIAFEIGAHAQSATRPQSFPQLVPKEAPQCAPPRRTAAAATLFV